MPYQVKLERLKLSSMYGNAADHEPRLHSPRATEWLTSGGKNVHCSLQDRGVKVRCCLSHCSVMCSSYLFLNVLTLLLVTTFSGKLFLPLSALRRWPLSRRDPSNASANFCHQMSVTPLSQGDNSAVRDRHHGNGFVDLSTRPSARAETGPPPARFEFAIRIFWQGDSITLCLKHCCQGSSFVFSCVGSEKA